MEMLPRGLERAQDDLSDDLGEPWGRRIVVAVMTLVVAAALLGVAGQSHVTRSAQGSAATLTVKAPERVRGGLMFQGRLDVVAGERIGRPRIVLGNGWTEEMQLNTLEPAPASATSSAGELELEYDALSAGDHLTIWMQFGVNPTGPGRRDRSVALFDDDRLLSRVPAKITVLP